MTPAEFKKKWARFGGGEMKGYQSHFDDLCRMLKLPAPIEADPTGESFGYQHATEKDAELDEEGARSPRRGFADVWKKGFFAWEYKGKQKNLDAAWKQLLRYREALANPPLLVVCDFHRYIVRTNFNGTVQETHEFTNDEIEDPKHLQILRAVLADPERLRPRKTTDEITKELAAEIGEIAGWLQKRKGKEHEAPKSRAALNAARRRNLDIARFLNRIIFCFFADGTGLLPNGLFASIIKNAEADPEHFAATLQSLFEAMNTGGVFGPHKIRHFNGHLFEDSTVFHFKPEELARLARAADADWQFIKPSIMGTLFQQALEETLQRSRLGAHYTSEEDIKKLCEPVLMAPLRAEWAAMRADLEAARGRGKQKKKTVAGARERLDAFVHKLGSTLVLDPACGSGNFLYVSLQLLLSLEKEVLLYGAELGYKLTPAAGVGQLLAIETNPYAFELAQVSVQIGFLQWRRENGFDNDQSPVLANLDGFVNDDALLHWQFRRKSLKDARAAEHEGDSGLRFCTEAEWPPCDVIVGNPPFIGDKEMRSELGDEYVVELRHVFGDRLPGQANLCAYWFEKARDLIARSRCKRAGLLGTTGMKQVGSRKVFERIKESGKIFFAISDEDWFDADTAIRICMVGFGGPGVADPPVLDGKPVAEIHADLTAGVDTTDKRALRANEKRCFMGTTKVGDFDIPEEQAVAMLALVNPYGRPNSDVLRPIHNGSDLVQQASKRWIIDFGVDTELESAALYEGPFKHVLDHVKPERQRNNERLRREQWWLFARARPDFRAAVSSLSRYLGTARVAKYRIFVWQDIVVLPDSKVIAIAYDDDFHFGVLQSRVHEAWTNATCALHGVGATPTYNPTECFETFPFPNASASESAAIAAAARDLHDLREAWLHPAEWTMPRTIELRASLLGPWSLHVDPSTVVPPGVLGTAHYTTLVPRDAVCAKQLTSRTLTELYNQRPAWLSLAHAKLDRAVALAYGLAVDAGNDEIIARLLGLNLERAEEEAGAGKRAFREKRPGELL